MSKLKLALGQFGNSYGGQQAFPLSVGCVWAYARSRTGVQQEYQEPVFLYKKEAIPKTLARLDPIPDLCAFSTYIWNWEYTKALARAIKEVSPHTTIVYGGVHIPDHPDDAWFDNHPECDFLLHGEGELSFSVFLEEFAGNRDWSKVPGLSCRDLHTERKFPPVEELRSPYLDGVFDDLLKQETLWTGLQETNRGCPFACTFCEWGTSALNKIRLFPMDRVLEEIEWFGRNRTDYLENCDANFALLARDVQITEALARTKEKYGYPTRFRAAFAKYSNKRISDQIYAAAKILKKSGQLKAVTMALQSTDIGVLENIDRKNISMSGFKETMDYYRKEEIPTYVEVIIGLPGETYNTFKKGLDDILDAGGHQGISIYMCMMLPNSEMSNPEYVKRHGLRSVPMRAMLIHGCPNPDAPDEIQETVIETNAMPHEEWKRAYMLSWAIQCLHTTGLTQWWAIQEREGGLKYSCFYESLLTFAIKNPDTVLGQVFSHTQRLLQGAIAGGSWDNVLPGFGDISWPPDEGGFLMIVQELERFYQEMEDYLLMPGEQRRHGPPSIPLGHEEAFSRVFWYNRKADLNKYLNDFCDSVR